MNTRVTALERLVRLPVGPGVEVEGALGIPADAKGLVVFVHGSGSSRHSPRNRLVAERLNRHGLGTLLFDLLTAEEERLDRNTGYLRFDIGFLASRVIQTIDWLEQQPRTRDKAIGLFGASTGAGAALVAAAERPDRVRTVVSRGGRPDLAQSALLRVTCPVLLIVGERDEPVIELNRLAMEDLHGPRHLAIVPGATHLFEEPGTLETAAGLAADWFESHLSPGRPERPHAT